MTQLAPRTESFGAGDQSWLGSRTGTDDAKSMTVKTSDWSTKISDGRIKSGEPVAIGAADAVVPYDSSDDTNGADTIVGFVLTDQSVSGDGNVTLPVVWHGRILTSNLPSTVAASAKTNGQFVLEA